MAHFKAFTIQNDIHYLSNASFVSQAHGSSLKQVSDYMSCY